MGDFLFGLFAFLVLLPPIVIVHELGHYLVAKRSGVRTLTFSIGFGKELWHRYLADGTRLRVAAVPLGGYVEMDTDHQGKFGEDARSGTFERAPLRSQLAILAAGPGINYLVAFVVFWGLALMPHTEVTAVIDQPAEGTLMADAGFEDGDRLVAVGEHETPSYQSVIQSFIRFAGHNGSIPVTVIPARDQQQEVIRELTVSAFLDTEEVDVARQLGLELKRPEGFSLAAISSGSAAADAGLEVGDEPIRIDGVETLTWQAFTEVVRGLPGVDTTLVFVRDGEVLEREITVGSRTDDTGEIGFLGVQGAVSEWPPERIVTSELGFFEAMQKSLGQLQYFTVITLSSIGKMVTGAMGTSGLSGPVGIASISADAISSGLQSTLFIFALLNLAIGLFNLLPIPVLDGGQMVLVTLRSFKGGRFHDKIEIAFMSVGWVIVLGVTIIALQSDLNRLGVAW